MNKLLLYLLESGTCLLVFYLFYSLVLKRETCFTYNRFYLLLTPLLSFLLPLTELSFIPQSEPLIIFVSEQLNPITIKASVARTPISSWMIWQIILLVVYGLGFGYGVFRFGRQLYLLYQLARQTQATSFCWNNIRVHKTEGQQPTFSFGNRIFWDNSHALSITETEQVFLHEAVHIWQKHTFDTLYLEFLRIVFWFNPLLYFFQKALTNTHEFIADAAVLRTTSANAYASILAKQVLHRLEFSFGNYFNKSLTLKRMKMIQQTQHRPSKLKQIAALPIAGVLAFMLACNDQEDLTKVKAQDQTNTEELKDGEIPDVIITQDQSITNELKGEEIFTFVEQNPTFPGGLEKMYQFLGTNIKYPEAAVKTNVQGNVITQFVVTKEGKITHINVVKSLSPETDAEAKRVIALMPTWKPGKQNGHSVNVQYTLPIRFALNGDEPKDNELTTKNSPDGPIFTQVDQVPAFPGGLEKMYRFLGTKIKYPKVAADAKLNGSVIAQFLVTKEGKITDLKILKSLSPETDAEAKRVISMMPAWEPGKQNGQPVNVQYTLPIRFALN